jgi:hypothetical protein
MLVLALLLQTENFRFPWDLDLEIFGWDEPILISGTMDDPIMFFGLVTEVGHLVEVLLPMAIPKFLALEIMETSVLETPLQLHASR